MSLKIVGASVILPDDVVETDVLVEDGVIAAMGTSSGAGAEIGGRGQYLAPAMIDVHVIAVIKMVVTCASVS